MQNPGDFLNQHLNKQTWRVFFNTVKKKTIKKKKKDVIFFES